MMTARAMGATYPVSDHYDGVHFFNPANRDSKGLLDVLKWKISSDIKKWPSEVQNAPKLKLSEKLKDGEVAVTFVNHATVLVQVDGLSILTDPVFAERVSPVSWAGPKRARKPGVLLEELPKIDLVVISHNHYDHMDLESLRWLEKAFKPQFLVPLGDKVLLERNKISKVTELDWWQQVTPVEEAVITFTPTQHFSGRGLWDRNKTLWGGYFIKTPHRVIYFGGDAGYSSHYTEIKDRLGKTDIALLPIGAYEPRWFMQPVHMNPSEAVQAHLDLGAVQSIGIHFGTFQLTDEAIDQPVIDLAIDLKARKMNPDVFVTLPEGQTRIFGQPRGG